MGPSFTSATRQLHHARHGLYMGARNNEKQFVTFKLFGEIGRMLARKSAATFCNLRNNEKDGRRKRSGVKIRSSALTLSYPALVGPSLRMVSILTGSRPPADARARRHIHHFHSLFLHTLSACPRPACPRRSGRELSSASIGGKTAAREGILVHV